MPGPEGAASLRTAAESALAHTPLKLADSVVLVHGANGHPMLFHARRGRYIRLSRLGASVVERLDGSYTGAQICELLSRQGVNQPEQAVLRFLGDLRNAGALTLAPERSFWTRLFRIEGLVRFPFPGWARPFFDALVDRLSSLPRWFLYSSCSLMLAMAAVLVPLTWLIKPPPAPVQASWPGFAAGMFIHLLLHETAHAVVCKYHGVSIREVGIGLLFYVLPVAYVDRTDAYLLPQRPARAAIALAGPATDLMGAGLSAAIALLGPGAVGDTAHTLFATQTLLFVTNLNPLMPSDGYHALEAALGELDLRRRCFAYLLHRLVGGPLPSALAYLKPGRSWWYLIFAGLTSAYTLLLVGAAVMALGWYLSPPWR